MRLKLKRGFTGQMLMALAVAGAWPLGFASARAQTAPSITVQAVSQSVLAGTNVTLSVVVSGTGPFTFQWVCNGTNLPSGIITTVAGSGGYGFYGDGGAATNAGLSYPYGVAVDSAGNLYIGDELNNRVRQVNSDGIISTVAGGGFLDGTVATNASFYPSGVAVDVQGNIFIADSGDARLRKVGANGIITTVAGGGFNNPGNSGAATNASLLDPSGVALDTTGNLFFADQELGRVFRVGANGIISVVAGNGSFGYSGDGGAATNSKLRGLGGLAVDGFGNVFIADTEDNVVRKVSSNGTIVTVAGGGTNYPGDGFEATNASLSPSGLAVDASGNLYIADSRHSRVWRVDVGGIITTVAGSGSGGYSGDGGQATNASLVNPVGVAVDVSGNLEIADTGFGGFGLGDGGWVRQVDPNGIITTVAGNGGYGYSGDGGLAVDATIVPIGVAPDGLGNLFIADSGYNRIRKVNPEGIISTVAGGGVGDGGPATNAILNNPCGVAVDASGNLLIADLLNSRVRKVERGGLITSVPGGSPGGGGFEAPIGVAVDAHGDLFIADAGAAFNNVGGPAGWIYEMDDLGASKTVAGGGSVAPTDGGIAVDSGLGAPTGVAVDAEGNVFIADCLDFLVLKVDANGFVTVVAGNGSGGFSGFSGEGGAATNASLALPTGVAVDSAGNVFIADPGSPGVGGGVRKVDLNGLISTVAGNGSPGYSGDGGPAVQASLNSPSGVALDALGNLFIADSGNGVVREVTPPGFPDLTIENVSPSAAGVYQAIITSPYGSVTSAVATLTVESPPSIVGQPGSLTVGAGRTATLGVEATGTPPLFYAWFFNGIKLVQNGTNSSLSLVDIEMAEGGGYTVVITNSFGRITSAVATVTVAPPPSLTSEPASQTVPVGGAVTLSVSAAGSGPFQYQWQLNGTNLAGAIITTVAGGWLGDGGEATNASIYPSGVAVDGLGNLYIADPGNQRVRKVTPDGIITTVAGGGTNYLTLGDEGSATNAVLLSSVAVALDTSGNLFIADSDHGPIRKVATNGTITTVAGGGTNYLTLGDGGEATNASIYPSGVAVDGLGNLYIADPGSQRVRKVTPDGIITTVAGGGTNHLTLGDGGAATNAQLDPLGVAVDGFGNIFIADVGHSRIRKVDANGIITTVAGGGTNHLVLGDGGLATNAAINPTGVTVDSFGNLFIADAGRDCIRKVDLDGIITTVAGDGFYGFAGDGGLATNASLNGPGGLAVDSSGEVFISDSGNARIRKVDNAGIITTVAGGWLGDGGAATNGSLGGPVGAAEDVSGNLFIVEQGNQRIRRVATNGVITTLAGNGLIGYSGDGGPATSASFDEPQGAAVDVSGNLFVADTDNNVIRKVDTNDIITTVAGAYSYYGIYSGDGGAATNANLGFPEGVAVDASGNLFIADTANNVIRKVDANGIITTVAGNGSSGYSGDGGAATNATFDSPESVAVDASGNLFIADRDNAAVRKVDGNGIISTLAGNGLGYTGAYSGDGGPATNSTLGNPSGVAVDTFGDLFIVDGTFGVIRRIDENGIITTVAGNGDQGFSGDGGLAIDASLDYPSGVAVDAAGNLLIADSGNNRVRKVGLAGFPTLTVDDFSAAAAGNYQVIVTSPYGSVTSAVATLVAEGQGPSSQIVMSEPLVQGAQLQLGFRLLQGTSPSFTLLQAPVIIGPWTTNTTAVLMTNAVVGGYLFTLPVPGTAQFYRVRSP